MVEDLPRVGIEAHPAEPADTSAACEPKQRAKSDWADARLLRDLLADGRLPESWIPPAQVLEMCARLHLFRDLREQHTAWVRRVYAMLLAPRRPDGHRQPAWTGQPPPARGRRGPATGGREAVVAALRIVDVLDAELDPLRKQITAFAARESGCRELQADYGIAPITAPALWTESGDSRRFPASRKAVRHTGPDITVHFSDAKRQPGRLSRQGSPLRRRALFGAAEFAAHPGSPDHAYYRRVAHRVGGNRAALQNRPRGGLARWAVNEDGR